ncbi:MAG: hypothetical protein M0R80_15510 [Proteobacteria bacterium]|jgi:hypothetical protein|nr:hypothetical protein [Pseudomonadota bacterium]
MRVAVIAGSLALALAVAPSCQKSENPSGSDTDSDTDSDSDIDSDTDTDTDSDTDADSDADSGPSDPACAMLYAGECAGLVAGCAACGDGSAPYEQLADCEADEWCCVPAQAPSNDCEQGGGICVPLTAESECPTGWESAETACGGVGVMCCISSDACA